jgi:hypothetical protein
MRHVLDYRYQYYTGMSSVSKDNIISSTLAAPKSANHAVASSAVIPRRPATKPATRLAGFEKMVPE